MFFDRSTRDGEETVVLRYAAAFYWLMWPTLALVEYRHTQADQQIGCNETTKRAGVLASQLAAR